MKIYLSADMEGTTGIVHWNETMADHPNYAYFQEQMSQEVAAACKAALEAGATEILVKDAHDSARNIIPTLLPKKTKLFRGWDDTPELMMAGIDSSYDGVIFTGYHAAAGSDSNPLSHTMSLKVFSIACNGRLLAEFDINAMIAAYYGVPVFFLSGDKGLCETAKQTIPDLTTVATNEGRGNAAVALHPLTAQKKIREGVMEALQKPKESCLYPLPERFQIEVCYKEHAPAAKAACYPGVTRKDVKTVAFETADLMDVIRTFLWIL